MINTDIDGRDQTAGPRWTWVFSPRHMSERPLFLLVLVGTANYLDRYILSITLPLIRAEFGIDDRYLGLLSGPVFAFVYAIFGVPFSILADRVGRRKVIAGALAFFSAATLACGLSVNFLQLVVGRFATGFGEAGVTPACAALISDRYPECQREGALSLLAASANIGLVFAFFGGGWIAEHYGWRMVFIVAAAVGLAILVAFLALVREAPIARTAAPAMPIRAVLAAFWARPVTLWVAGGAALTSIHGYAAIAFVPSFLARSHHMSPATIGLTVAVLSGGLGWIGTALPGLLAGRLKPDDPGFALKLASMGLIVSEIFQPVFYLASDVRVSIAALTVPALLSAVFLGPSYHAMQRTVPVAMRAQAIAYFLLVLNLIGLGLGPQLAGFLSYALKPDFGEDALRYALLVTALVPPLLAAGCFWRAARLMQAGATVS